MPLGESVNAAIRVVEWATAVAIIVRIVAL